MTIENIDKKIEGRVLPRGGEPGLYSEGGIMPYVARRDCGED